MPAIALPILTTTSINLPTPPSNPPTKKDLARATRLRHNALIAHTKSTAIDEDLANISIYEHKIVSKIT
ncbi:hypothetical protein H0H87_011623, partial [Tephrocybe sp. NHM501043]